MLEGARLAYALVRPPGHHAERKAFGGFCYFNNAAIAANHLSRFGRVAVLDIDYHHGNGTQDIFYDRADVLTISIHGHPRFAYPYFSGFREETGVGAGAGYNLNIPLAEHTTPAQHREAVQRAIRRIQRHDPAYLVLALGLDTAKGDPTGTWSNSAADFESMGQLLGGVGLPTLIVQEGGYRVRTLGVNARHFLKGISDAAWRAAPALRRVRGSAPAAPAPVEWRDTLRRSDIEQVRVLAATSGVFSTAQSAAAVAMAAARIERGDAGGQEFVVAEESGRLVGYACFGPAVGTTDRFDLSFLAVEHGRQRAGIGRELMTRAEAAIVTRGGRRAYAGASNAQPFAPARRFLTAMGYRKAAELPDYYADGEGQSIYMKALER